jgi:hypothetical protein
VRFLYYVDPVVEDDPKAPARSAAPDSPEGAGGEPR